MLPALALPPALLYEDNAACRSMVTCSQVSGRNKHFELKQHFIREVYQAKLLLLKEVSTARQVADIFTKSLARPAYETHREPLLNGITLEVIEGSDIQVSKDAPTEGGC